MARTSEPKGPDWTPERTLQMLRQQLDELREMRQRNNQEVSKQYEVWKSTTWAVFEHGFGKESRNLTDFNWAGYAARKRNQQEDFQLVTEKEETALLSSIKELEMGLPEAELKGAYDAGDEFAFYKDLKEIMSQARADIFIVDNYLDTEFFELYVATVKAGVHLRIMTDQLKGNLEAVAKKYAANHSIELRSSPDVHDRHIFVDNRGWTVGQSIKDAAKKKPTYMVELSAGLVPTIRKIYEDLWAKAAVVVKS